MLTQTRGNMWQACKSSMFIHALIIAVLPTIGVYDAHDNYDVNTHGALFAPATENLHHPANILGRESLPLPRECGTACFIGKPDT